VKAAILFLIDVHTKEYALPRADEGHVVQVTFGGAAQAGFVAI